MVNDDASIRYVFSAINRNLFVWDEEDGVGSLNSASNALSQLAQFVCKRVCLCLFVCWTFMRCRYSMEAPVVASMMACAPWVCCKGWLLDCAAIACSCDIGIQFRVGFQCLVGATLGAGQGYVGSSMAGGRGSANSACGSAGITGTGESGVYAGGQ